jgi:ribonuclease E
MNMIRILINSTQPEELRVAITKGDKLDDLDIERIGAQQNKANIYKGIISRIEPSLGAAFVDYGAERHGFLPLREIEKSYFAHKPTDDFTKLNIKDLLQERQEVIIQVDKEERGSKGAALTTFISIPGAYLVLMPNNPRAGGISKRIEGEDRDDLRDILSKLVIPEGMGVIIRTSGVGKTLEELQWDLDSLLHYWETIKAASQQKPAPFLIHREDDVVIRALRDYLRSDVVEIWTDEMDVYTRVKEYIQQVRPEFIDRLKLYQNKTSLFSHFKIEKQIEAAYNREVILPSGGSIVIDHTEALVSIDVNSAKATGGKDIEETAFNTNVEAAQEIARQLRIRDIGGLIVIDFIDMVSSQNQREIANKLREALSSDRARVRIGNITKFGLMEMSRQRVRPPIGEAIQITCPRCDGQGRIRSTTSLALSIIRIVEEEASNEKVAQIQVQVPIDLAAYMLNEKRAAIAEIERRNNIRILVIPNPYIKTPKYKIKTLKVTELPKGERDVESYKLIEAPKIEVPVGESRANIVKPEEPAVRQHFPHTPAPTPKKKSKIGLLLKSLASVFSGSKEEAAKPHHHPQTAHRPSSTHGKPFRYNNRPRFKGNYRRPPGQGQSQGQGERRK